MITFFSIPVADLEGKRYYCKLLTAPWKKLKILYFIHHHNGFRNIIREYYNIFYSLYLFNKADKALNVIWWPRYSGESPLTTSVHLPEWTESKMEVKKQTKCIGRRYGTDRSLNSCLQKLDWVDGPIYGGWSVLPQ